MCQIWCIGRMCYYFISISCFSIHWNLATVASCIVLLKKTSFGEFTALFFMDCEKSIRITPLASQNTVAITLPAENCAQSFFAWRNQVLHTLDIFFWLIVMGPSLIYSYEMQKTKLPPFDLNCFTSPLLTHTLVAICSLLRNLGTQQPVSLHIPKWSIIIKK